MQKNQLTITPILLMLFAIFLVSCKTDNGFRRELRSAAQDGNIDSDEWQQLTDLYEADASLQEEGSLEKIILDSHPDVSIEDISGPPPPPGRTISEVAVLVENSASMYGFLEGNTRFKDALLDLLTRFSDKDGGYVLYSTNDQELPFFDNSSKDQNSQLVSFIQKLNPEELRQMGNFRETKLNEIIQRAIERTKREGQPVVIVSDFIASISGESDMRNQLTAQKYTIKEAVQGLPDDYGMLLIKFQSNFDGTYYSFDENYYSFEGNLPYYMWVFGPVDLLREFPDLYQIETLKDHQNHFTIFGSSKAVEPPYYSVLPNFEGSGRFRPADRGSPPVTTLEEVRPQRNKETFQFAVAVDLSQYPLSDSYLTDPSNYRLSADVSDPGRILEVRALSSRDVNPSDRGSEGSATHLIIIEGNDLSAPEVEMTVELIFQLPDWIAASTNENDTALQPNTTTTFGFGYLVEGVAAAITQNNLNYTIIQLPINLTR